MDLMAIRRSLMMGQKKARLPRGFREVKWIERTYRQYINTLCFASNKSKAECGFWANPIDNTPIFGSRDYAGVGNKDFDVIAYGGNFGLIVRFNSQNITKVPLYAETYYELSMESGRIALNGEVFSTFEPTAFQQTLKTVTLFLRNMEDMVNRADGKNTRISFYRFYENGLILRDYVPCYRESDNKPGMYDLCGSICPLTNSPFYINAGTGEFLVGPEV